VNTASYLLMKGTAFVNPPNPRTYPANVAGNAAAGVQSRAEAGHKEEIKEYETFQGVIQATKDIILEAVDSEYLLKIENEILGFLYQTTTQMLTHLRNRREALDFADTKHCEQKVTENGTPAKSHKYTSTGLKKQSNDTPMPASTWT
jgi:hypothetical protein